MADKKYDGPKFTGGDNLEGLYKLYHEAMMKNELYDGYGAYKVVYAGEKSGISFGGNQMDMSADPEYREKFVSILKEATDKYGKSILTDNEILLIGGNALNKENPYPKLKITGQTPEQVFGQYLPKVNAALSSEYGRKAIDTMYPSEIYSKAAHIEKFISQVNTPAAKEFYNTEMGKVLLFDYHNQFGLDLQDAPNPRLLNYLNSGKITAYTGKELKFNDQYSIDHHKDFILNTKQATEKYENSSNRLKNIENILKEHNILPETPPDQKLSNTAGELSNAKVAGECEGGECVSSFEKSLSDSSRATIAPEPNHGLGYLVKVADLGNVVVASQKNKVLVNGNVVVLWVTHQDNYAEFAAFFQIHNKVGEKLTDPISISPAWDTDLAALNNGNFLIYGNKKLYCFDSTGSLLKNSTLDHLKYDSYQITLTVTSDNRILLNWHDSIYDQNGVRSWQFKGKYYNNELIPMDHEFNIFHGNSANCQLTAEENSMIGIFCAEDAKKSGTGADSLVCRGDSKKAFGCFGLLDTGQTDDQKFLWANWPIQKEEHTLLYLNHDRYVISENGSVNNKLYTAIMDSKGKAVVTNLLDPTPDKYRINLSKINSHETNQEFLMTWETGEFHENRSIQYQKFNENGTTQGEAFTISHFKGSNHHLASSYNEELYAISWLYSSYKQQNWFHSEYGYSSAWQNIKDFTTSYIYVSRTSK